MPAIKDDRIAFRLPREQSDLIRQAAEAQGTTVTEFTAQATITRAHDVLADRRFFLIDDAAWTEFNAILERPVEYKPRLSKLFAEPSIFE